MKPDIDDIQLKMLCLCSILKSTHTAHFQTSAEEIIRVGIDQAWIQSSYSNVANTLFLVDYQLKELAEQIYEAM